MKVGCGGAVRTGRVWAAFDSEDESLCFEGSMIGGDPHGRSIGWSVICGILRTIKNELRSLSKTELTDLQFCIASRNVSVTTSQCSIARLNYHYTVYPVSFH